MTKEELYRDTLESIRDYCIERSHIIYCDNIGDKINNILEKADSQPEDSADTESKCPNCVTGYLITMTYCGTCGHECR